MSSDLLSGYIKALEAFSISDSFFFFFFFKLGLIGCGLGFMIFHKMSSMTHHDYLYQNHCIWIAR